MAQGRSIDEILTTARGELEDREARLQDIVTRAKGELDDVRRALRRLGKRSVRKASANGGAPKREGPNTDLREQILTALRESLDPLKPAEICERIDAETTPAGVAACLRAMAAEDGRVTTTEGGWGIAAGGGE